MEMLRKGEAAITIGYNLDPIWEPDWLEGCYMEGYMYLEGVGILKDSKHVDLAKKFVDYVLTMDFQGNVSKNWMYPVVEGASIPSEWEKGQVPRSVVTASSELASRQAEIVERFKREIMGG